ncbi:hypothetical protein B5E84_16135 [Lachnoclostridium sp. An14]|uniref:helix-turn-helix domain-containing protein n=1 Tax=Lachnoclostridium sp. An14 TaxID=1965562 RepID=UPI000B38A917|nr:helix-turn-helix transcriptional regulator [Lachnoclostridium sp. An14]OUQ14475.1 hypothetical protein B5E84_16135 [Lachnoclostridium sp. An14]
MNIGERIKKIRTEKGISTYQLSELTGISQSSISKLENGHRKADIEILMKIARALNISIDRLTGDSVGSIIEERIKELRITLDEVAKKSQVPLSWLQNIDDFVPGDMEFKLENFEEDKALDWDDVIGDHTSYKLISRVAETLGLPPSQLRAALARQEIPLPDAPPVSAVEAFGESQNSISVDGEKPQIINYYNQLNTLGQETATEQVRLLTLDKKYTEKKQNFPSLTRDPDADYIVANAAHERTDIELTDEDQKHDDDIMNDDSNWG